ncbi:MAG TPA: helix-turn-helix transcriptional regulator, partial [Ktedonobacterales bacterium]|nr:helix-turn-helix transcriptional regulator [Ktedonobacterales bacterium]
MPTVESPAFGELLKRHRLAAGLSQEELAACARLSVDAISTLERGTRRRPRKDTVALLAEALGLEGEERAAFFASSRPVLLQAALDDMVPSADHGPYPQRIPRDLPPRIPGFVGRKEDLQTLCDLLQSGRRPGAIAIVVGLVGMGGVGKSALAAEAMHRLAAEPPAFSGGITWVRCDERVELAGLIWVEDQLLAAWGAPLSAEAIARVPTPEEGLALRKRALWDRLRPAADESAAPAPALVVLDNVEHGLPLGHLLDTLQPLGVTTLL